MKQQFRLLLFIFLCYSVQSNAQKLPVKIGLNTGYENDSLGFANGYDYIEENTRKLFYVPDSVFQKHLANLRKTKLPVNTTNVFLPNTIKLIGPDINVKWTIGYVDTIFKRAQQAGVNIIVLGSSGSRRLPEGYSRNKAISEFVYIGRKMAEVAKKYKITIAMESLNRTEDNFITTLEFANELVNLINHPNFKLTADIYHMLMEYEPADVIIKAGKNLVHCHIAEREKRAAPGTYNENFLPYFQALKKINYKGRISLECRWDNMAQQAPSALAYLKTQLNQAYNIKP